MVRLRPLDGSSRMPAIISSFSTIYPGSKNTHRYRHLPPITRGVSFNILRGELARILKLGGFTAISVVSLPKSRLCAQPQEKLTMNNKSLLKGNFQQAINFLDLEQT